MVSVLEPCTILRVQSWDIRKTAPSRAEEAAGVLWPKVTGTFARGAAEVVCVGPTDWLVLAGASGGTIAGARAANTNAAAGTPHTAGSASVALLSALAAAFQDSTFRITDVSQALARLQIAGPQARPLLAKACSTNVSPQAFPVGRSARTRFAGMPVVVRCLEPETFECIVSQSYREYLVAWLADAAVEY